MLKRIILISVSIVFFSVAAVGIGWIVKKEIDKGENKQEQSVNIPKESNNIIDKKGDIPSESSTSNEDITIGNKKEASKALEEMDGMFDSMGSDFSK